MSVQGLREVSTEKGEFSRASVSGVVDLTWQDIVRSQEWSSVIDVTNQDIWQISVWTVAVTRETRKGGLVRQQRPPLKSKGASFLACHRDWSKRK